jgi:hypothetical protein
VKAKVRDLLSEMKKKMLPSGRRRTVAASRFALRVDEPGYVGYSEFDDETSRFGLRALETFVTRRSEAAHFDRPLSHAQGTSLHHRLADFSSLTGCRLIIGETPHKRE